MAAVGSAQSPPPVGTGADAGVGAPAQSTTLYRQGPAGGALALRFQEGSGVLADDFTVPAGQVWTIDAVGLVGGLHDTSLAIRFYEDAEGSPGRLIDAFTAPPFATQLVREDENVYRVRLPRAITLPAGTFWLGVYYGSGEAFYWREFDHANGQPLHFTSDEVHWSNMGDYSDHSCCDLAFDILGWTTRSE